MSPARRLEMVIAKMERGGATSIRKRVDGESPEGFLRQVDWAKGMIRSYAPKFGCLKNPQPAHELRAELERHPVRSGYFGMHHLAVALSELGYAVTFSGESYFKTNFPVGPATKALQNLERAR